jgi:hypothetical protein
MRNLFFDFPRDFIFSEIVFDKERITAWLLTFAAYQWVKFAIPANIRKIFE